MPTTSNFGWTTPADTDYVKDGALAIRTLGNGIDTSFVDLKGGTSGQYLVKNSNTDLDFTWTTNTADIDGITASSPLTGGGTSGTITVGIQDGTTAQKGAVQLEDSTSSTSTTKAATPNSVKSAYDLANGAIAKSVVDAKGDLIVATADNTVARLAVGTNDYVLTAASGETTGLKWAAVNAGGMTLLQSLSLSGSSTASSTLSTSYTNLYIVLKDVYASGVDHAYFRLNADTNSNYAYNQFDQNGATTNIVQSANNSIIYFGYIGTDTDERDKLNGIIEIPRYNDTGATYCFINTYTTIYNVSRGRHGNGVYDNSAGITSITFYAGGETFSGGTAYIYGVK